MNAIVTAKQTQLSSFLSTLGDLSHGDGLEITTNKGKQFAITSLDRGLLNQRFASTSSR